MAVDEARRLFESRVGILPKVLADVTSPLGDRAASGLPESGVIAQLGTSQKETRDTWRVSTETAAGIVPEAWLAWGFGTEEDAAPSSPGVDLLAVHARRSD